MKQPKFAELFATLVAWSFDSEVIRRLLTIDVPADSVWLRVDAVTDIYPSLKKVCGDRTIIQHSVVQRHRQKNRWMNVGSSFADVIISLYV